MENNVKLKGLLLCDGGLSSSWIAAKLNHFAAEYNLTLDEGALHSTNMDDAAKKYDVVLLAPHLRAAYEDYEDMFEEAGVPFIQIEQSEYSGTADASTKLFKRVATEMKLI